MYIYIVNTIYLHGCRMVQTLPLQFAGSYLDTLVLYPGRFKFVPCLQAVTHCLKRFTLDLHYNCKPAIQKRCCRALQAVVVQPIGKDGVLIAGTDTVRLIALKNALKNRGLPLGCSRRFITEHLFECYNTISRCSQLALVFVACVARGAGEAWLAATPANRPWYTSFSTCNLQSIALICERNAFLYAGSRVQPAGPGVDGGACGQARGVPGRLCGQPGGPGLRQGRRQGVNSR